MVRLPWLPVLAQYLQKQASSADAARTRVPQLPPPLLDVLHTSKLGLTGGACAKPDLWFITGSSCCRSNRIPWQGGGPMSWSLCLRMSWRWHAGNTTQHILSTRESSVSSCKLKVIWLLVARWLLCQLDA